MGKLVNRCGAPDFSSAYEDSTIGQILVWIQLSGEPLTYPPISFLCLSCCRMSLMLSPTSTKSARDPCLTASNGLMTRASQQSRASAMREDPAGAMPALGRPALTPTTPTAPMASSVYLGVIQIQGRSGTSTTSSTLGLLCLCTWLGAGEWAL